MNKRGYSWIVVVTILSSVLNFTGANSAQAASTVTTTTMTPSVSTPTYGDLVTFTVTVTPTEYSIPVVGNVVITGRNGGGALCETSNLVETGPGRTVTGTCTWIARSSASLNYNDIKATYNGLKNASNVLVYGSSSSSTFSGFKVLGVTNLSVPRMTVGSNGNTLTVTANTEGVVRFKDNGQEISGCGTKSVISPNFTATCSYDLPTPTNSFEASHIFTVDFTPTGKTIVLNQFTKKFTPDSYYLPRTCTNTNCNIYQSTYANFNGASDATPYVNAGYVRVDNIFYKLNRSTMEAMAVGYDKFQGISALNFPEILIVPSAAVPSGESLFAGSYSITTIGAWAFTLNTGFSPHTLLTSVTLPSTLRVVGEFAFRGQCGITTLDLPDSLQYVGQTAFGGMNKFGSGFAGCTGSPELGLKTIKFGAGFVALWGGVMTGDTDITTLSFRGAPSDLLPLGEFYELGVENWQVTASTQNQYMNPFVEVSNNSCISNLSYAGNLQVNVLAAQTDAWKYWAQGCLTGVVDFKATIYKPNTPSIPVGSNPTHTSINVDYLAPASNGGSPIDYYEITTLPVTTTTRVLGASSGSVVVDGLTPATTYRFKVRAHNVAQAANGNTLAYAGGDSDLSAFSASISTLTPSAPATPTIGTVAATGATAISIPYTAGAINGSAITGYTTTSSPSVSLTLTSAATANPLTYSGTFVQGQAYTFSMTATNGAGTSSSSSASNSITPYAAAAPAAGIIGSATSSNATTVSVPFTAPASNGSSITSYSVSSSPSIALTYSGTTSPMAVTGAFVQGQSYTFTIAATNGAGSGAASSASNAVTPFAAGRPDAPTIGIGTVIDSQTVTVSFSAPANNRGAAISNYTATSSPGGITASSTSSPITVTGLTVNTAYTFTVTATNSAGTSDSSTATSSITPRMAYSVTFNSQGGSSISDGSFISGESVTAPGSNPTRSGYTYNGWFAAATGGSVLVFPYSPGVTSNITLYAQWTAIPVVVPPAPTPVPVVVSGPPPSTLKTLSTPKISRDDKSYYCEVGKYVFLREGRTEENPKLTTQVFHLLVNGQVIDSVKSVIDRVSFAHSDSFLNSTLTCQVEVGQENLSTTSYSLNSADIARYSLAKKNAIEAADTKYYKERQDAYSKKDLEFARLLAIKNTGVGSSKTSKDILSASLTYQKAYTAASNLWKKELADAATNRVLAKELAQKQYLDALEAAGISIYPVAVKAVVTPTPTPTPTPTLTPTLTPTPTPTNPAVNVQPTSEMQKVGTLYMASGSYFLNDASKISLKAIALKIKASDKNSILVYGHTDSRGGVNNTVLSQNRAKAVANYLRPLLKGKKIVIGWYASRKPAATGTTASDLAKNRRVEIYTK